MACRMIPSKPLSTTQNSFAFPRNASAHFHPEQVIGGRDKEGPAVGRERTIGGGNAIELYSANQLSRPRKNPDATRSRGKHVAVLVYLKAIAASQPFFVA